MNNREVCCVIHVCNNDVITLDGTASPKSPRTRASSLIISSVYDRALYPGNNKQDLRYEPQIIVQCRWGNSQGCISR